MARLRSLARVLLCLVTWLVTGVRCVRITSLTADNPVIAGESAWLRCDWATDGDPVYAIKWYWGVHEFYRWVPKTEDPIMIFEVEAFTVDKLKSSEGHVFLTDVSLKARGIMRCEVSGEGPTFHTDYREVKLDVVDLPDTRPRIATAKTIYEPNETVRLTCTSPRSKPAASLSFYINGEKANSSWLITYPPQIEPDSRLLTAMLGLHFPLRPRLLEGGKAVVKCAATLKDLYWESNEQVIVGNVLLRASRMEERASVNKDNANIGVPTAAAVIGHRPGEGLGWLCLCSILLRNMFDFRLGL